MKNTRLIWWCLFFIFMFLPRLFASEKIKIVALGDSTTAGTPGFVSPREYPPNGRGDEQSQYSYWAMKQHPEWEIINQGINGQRSDQILKRFEADVVRLKPRAIIVLAGVNDLYQGIPLEKIKDNLTRIYEKAEKEGILIFACSVIPYNFSTFEVKEKMKGLNEWIRSYSKEKGYEFCDTYKAVEDPKRPGWLISSPDGLHPDKEGYRKVGETISACLETLLKDPAASGK